MTRHRWQRERQKSKTVAAWLLRGGRKHEEEKVSKGFWIVGVPFLEIQLQED